LLAVILYGDLGSKISLVVDSMSTNQLVIFSLFFVILLVIKTGIEIYSMFRRKDK